MFLNSKLHKPETNCLRETRLNERNYTNIQLFEYTMILNNIIKKTAGWWNINLYKTYNTV